MKPVTLIIRILAICIFSLAVMEAVAAVDREAGRVISTRCAICHGPNGEGNGLPKSCLACIDTKTFLQNIHDFQKGVRRNYMMERYAKQLSDQDVKILVAYYASEKEELDHD